MVCLDTSFLIDVIKGKEEVKDLEEKIVIEAKSVTIASPSIVELFRGLYLQKNIQYVDQDEINRISKIISSFIILNLDKDSAALAGRIEAGLINEGEKIDIEDIMIAAIAMQNNETLLTRNVKHFE